MWVCVPLNRTFSLHSFRMIFCSSLSVHSLLPIPLFLSALQLRALTADLQMQPSNSLFSFKTTTQGVHKKPPSTTQGDHKTATDVKRRANTNALLLNATFCRPLFLFLCFYICVCRSAPPLSVFLQVCLSVCQYFGAFCTVIISSYLSLFSFVFSLQSLSVCLFSSHPSVHKKFYKVYNSTPV